MTRWECPEDVVMDAPPYGRVVRTVDVPRLCREEAEKAVMAVWHDKVFGDHSRGFDQIVHAYLAARFPETAPEPKEPPSSPLHCAHTMCHRGDCTACFPTPSATAEPKPDLLKLAQDVFAGMTEEEQERTVAAIRDRRWAAPPSEAPAKREPKTSDCRMCGNPCEGEWGKDWEQNMWGRFHAHCVVPMEVPPATLNEAVAAARPDGGTYRQKDAVEAYNAILTGSGVLLTPAERDFLRALAGLYAYYIHECSWQTNWRGAPDLMAAARKVVG